VSVFGWVLDVVVTISVEVPEPPGTDAGLNPQLTPVGSGAEQDSATAPLNPSTGVIVIVEVADCPTATPSEPGTAIWKSVPVPDKFTTCGLLFALSVTTSVPVLLPTAVGVKVRLIVQLADGANVEPQVLEFDTANGPVVAILVIRSCALPVLVSDIAWALLVLFTSCG